MEKEDISKIVNEQIEKAFTKRIEIMNETNKKQIKKKKEEEKIKRKNNIPKMFSLLFVILVLGLNIFEQKEIDMKIYNVIICFNFILQLVRLEKYTRKLNFQIFISLLFNVIAHIDIITVRILLFVLFMLCLIELQLPRKFKMKNAFFIDPDFANGNLKEYEKVAIEKQERFLTFQDLLDELNKVRDYHKEINEIIEGRKNNSTEK